MLNREVLRIGLYIRVSDSITNSAIQNQPPFWVSVAY
jgi:hypothetical protein